MPWRREVTRILKAMASVSGIRARCEAASFMLLGSPYRANPLGGGPGRRERIRLTLTCFDCVTFVEAVAALAHARTGLDYRACLLRMRYGGKEPSWEHRLHYWSHWLSVNEQHGLLTVVSPPPDGPIFVRTLASVPGIPQAMVSVHAHPWSPVVPPSDVVAFVSEREELDVFHVGILVGDRLRHASRSRGVVLDEPLASFLAREHGAGLLLARWRAE